MAQVALCTPAEKKSYLLVESFKDRPYIEKILREHPLVHGNCFVSQSNTEQDKYGGVDFIFHFPSISCAARVRSHNCYFTDVTFRVRSYQAVPTASHPKYSEFNRLVDNKVDWNWLFYARRSATDRYTYDKWIIIDKDQLLTSGVLSTVSPIIWNTPVDGTGFRSISIKALFEYNCVIYTHDFQGTRDYIPRRVSNGF